MLKRIKLQIPAEQKAVFDTMIKEIVAKPLHTADLQLERLVLFEFYNRNVRRFIFMDSKPILLELSEALVLNRILLATSFTAPNTLDVARSITWQLDRLFIDNKKLNE